MFQIQYVIACLIAHLNHYLAQQNAYLIQENRILRSKLGKQIRVTPAEKALLLRFAAPLGRDILDIVSIVQPATFARWLREAGDGIRRHCRPTGRPPTREELVELVLRINDENPGWGYRKVHGELTKLGVRISKTTVYNILHENGREPGPFRECPTWAEFLEIHLKTLYACDFFTTRVWTWRGPVTFYVLVFIHIESRRLWLAGATPNPNDQWMVRQATRFGEYLEERGDRCDYLVLDQDTKYTKRFKLRMAAQGIELKFISKGAPKMNAYAEAVIKTIKRECIRRFTIIGRSHLMYLMREYLHYYNHFRCHRGLGNVPVDPDNRGPEELTTDISSADVESISFLGGLHHHYYRKAA